MANLYDIKVQNELNDAERYLRYEEEEKALPCLKRALELLYDLAKQATTEAQLRKYTDVINQIRPKYDELKAKYSVKEKQPMTTEAIQDIIENKEEKQETVETKEEKEPGEPARQKLDKLIGLQSVKEEIAHLENIILTNEKKKALGLPTIEVSKHMVFTGNPGTGKTTVARIVAQIFKENGLLKKGQLIETDRGGLVDQFIGGTAQKTKKKIEEALGGVLFIDEAYALIPGDSEKDFGHEAIATLLKYMEDYKDDFVVIVAGYEKEMHRFIESNSGLKSRFTTYINFQDYTPNELQLIFENIIKKDQYILTPKAKEKLVVLWNESLKYTNLGNGRAVRNVYEKIQRLQATRIIENNLESKEELMTITIDDIPSADEVFQ